MVEEPQVELEDEVGGEIDEERVSSVNGGGKDQDPVDGSRGEDNAQDDKGDNSSIGRIISPSSSSSSFPLSTDTKDSRMDCEGNKVAKLDVSCAECVGPGVKCVRTMLNMWDLC